MHTAPDPYIEELRLFIRNHRGSEANFEKLRQKLMEAYDAAVNDPSKEDAYTDGLKETLEKHADLYQQKKEKGISAWPDFENFVSHFEKIVT